MSKYDTRHGGPYDRGGADSYYRRPCLPHYYIADTYGSKRVEKDQMTAEEIEAYLAGYSDNQEAGAHKTY